MALQEIPTDHVALSERVVFNEYQVVAKVLGMVDQVTTKDVDRVNQVAVKDFDRAE